jgi:very-short-patch-repair endonuclease
MSTATSMREVARATRHHGVATVDDIALTKDQLNGLVEAVLLHRRHIGVYVNPAVPRSPLQDLAAGVAAAGWMSGAWGRSAGASFDLLDDFPPTPEIVVPVNRRVRIPGVMVHRSVDLCRNHLTKRHGIWTTNPLVTVLDLGVTLDADTIAEVLVRGTARRIFTLAAVRATVARLARPGRTGVRNVRAALDMLDALEVPLESVLELRFLLLAQRQGLPRMVFQHEVRIGGRTYRIDAAYPDLKLAIEVDGYAKRASPEAMARDLARQNALVLAGWTILRFPWSRIVGDPSSVAEEIMRALWSLARAAHA